ncbi:MAG TPA: LacI family DNA-binding transcriptional regulator [Bacteroidales bacterium]|nr:LacI family DNA-binding transcriptional regulator [Bacteroidales bacterium]
MAKKFKNKDLAAKLGVSSTLVSLVLNNKADQQGIKKDTQEKVLSLARQMGYFDILQDKNEISPVEEKPGVLGMIVPSVNDPFVVQISPFLQKAFSSIGVGFSIVTKDPDDQRYDRLINTFRKFYSGLILLGNAADENTIRTLRTADYPFVLLEKTTKTQRLNTISTDTTAGATLVVNHLDKLGYKNIIIVTDRKAYREDKTAVYDLMNALSQKEDINKPVVVEMDKPTDDSIDTVFFDKFLRPPHKADIMIIMNASLVYPVMAMLRKKNLRIPQDIAVISMEEGAGFDLLFSPVTCLRKPLSGMSIKVANMIWSEVKNSGKGKFKRQVNIAPELIIRSSCGTFRNSQN